MTTKVKSTTGQLAVAAGAAVSKTTKTAPATKAAVPAKMVANTTAKAVATAAKPSPVKAVNPPKADKPKKVKMVRDSFTMPETDYSQLVELKKKCLQSGVHVKKSELLRVGLLSLSRMSDIALLEAVAEVEKLKTGRPAKQ
ncbi:MAG TPA: hypothetical protein VMV97_02590 [Sulfuriferula sp.]|nr:hypothetical protein [Sulfuriferula sp.]